jgi:hypothetical protein
MTPARIEATASVEFFLPKNSHCKKNDIEPFGRAYCRDTP